MEELQYVGYWWLPSKEETMVPGILTFSNEDGIRLALIGSFRELRGTSQSPLPVYPLVLGLTEGKLLTVCDSVETRISMSGPGFTSQELSPRMAYIGAHFADPGELRFHKADVEYSHLPDWVGLTGFQPSYDIENQSGLKKYQLAYVYPEKVKASTSKGKVSVTYSFRSGGDLLREVRLRQSVWMRIETNKELPFEELHSQFIYPLQNLLTMATARPNSLVNASVYSRAKSATRANGTVRELPIQVVFPVAYHLIEPGKRLMPDDMLFTLQDVAQDFRGVIERWLEVADELDSVCNLFFGVQYSPRMYFEHQFLNMVQAAESYHRRRYSKQVLPEEEHRNRIDSILTTSEGRYREWLAVKLKWSNEPSLRRRIRELIDVADRVISALAPDKESFIQKVLDTRNFIIHHDPSLEGKAAQGAELYQLTQTLSFLVQACLLGELGFSAERCVELFRRNRRYVYAMREAEQSG